jgi:hypothetical protein
MAISEKRRELLSKGLALGALVTTASGAALADDQQTSPSNAAPTSNPTPLLDSITAYANQQKASLKALAAFVPDGGKDPIPRDDKTWKAIIDRARQSLQITADESLAAELNANIFQISKGFLFKQEVEDKNFHPNQVEELLSAASILLDRGLRDKREWQDRAEKRFNVATELFEYRELDKIHSEETAAGFYTVNSIESSATREAEIRLANGNRLASLDLDWLLKNKYNNAELNNQSGQYQLMAWLAHLAAYQYPNMGNLLQNVWNGQPNTSPEFMKNAAFVTSWHTFAAQSSSLMAQQTSYSGYADSSDEKGVGYRTRADWENVDVGFRRRRTEVARRVADLKGRAFTEPGGALNFNEQMLPIKKRFERDFRDALARIIVAAQGLKDIYGYAIPLPSTVVGIGKTNADSDAVFDESALWVRDAVAWLTRFSYLDQNYSVPISVRRAVAKDAWKTGLKNGRWQVLVKETDFPNQVHIRLRGISAFVVFDQGTSDWERDSSIWNVSVRAPKSATVRRMDGSLATVDQSYIPPARLARVALRSFVHDPDITGVAAMHNVSPLGAWDVAISTRSINGVSLDRVRDLQIDLHLAVRSPDAAFTAESSKNVTQYDAIE